MIVVFSSLKMQKPAQSFLEASTVESEEGGFCGPIYWTS
jgi:hypothetical protein